MLGYSFSEYWVNFYVVSKPVYEFSLIFLSTMCIFLIIEIITNPFTVNFNINLKRRVSDLKDFKFPDYYLSSVPIARWTWISKKFLTINEYVNLYVNGILNR